MAYKIFKKPGGSTHTYKADLKCRSGSECYRTFSQQSRSLYNCLQSRTHEKSNTFCFGIKHGHFFAFEMYQKADMRKLTLPIFNRFLRNKIRMINFNFKQCSHELPLLENSFTSVTRMCFTLIPFVFRTKERHVDFPKTYLKGAFRICIGYFLL